MECANEDGAPTLVELGTASTDTKGGMGHYVEPMGLWHRMAISDD
jgi:hypothetical protein